MKIDAGALNYIQSVIKVADVVKIGNLVIEPGRVRGTDEKSSVFILHTSDVPDFSFGSIGINRLPEFTARLTIGQTATNLEIDATIEPNGESPFVRAIQFKAKKVKLDYRCANPKTVMAIKTIKSPFAYQFETDQSTITFMQKGQTAYKCENVSFVGTSDSVTMEMVDINNDKMQCDVCDYCSLLEGDNLPTDVKFTFKYPIKVLIPLLRSATSLKLTINTAGVLRINVHGFDVHVIPVQ